MQNSEFRYVLPALAPSEFPYIPRSDHAQLTCVIEEDGEVEIRGNREGLLYLARHLAAMGMVTGVPGLHIHLDPDTGELDPGSSIITISNSDFVNCPK
jgi:hypothetical protein